MMIPSHLASGVVSSEYEEQSDNQHVSVTSVSTPAARVANMTQRTPAAPQYIGGVRVGQRVKHPSFGDGVVMKVEPSRDDAVITVVFPKQGIKKLLASLANLKIIK